MPTRANFSSVLAIVDNFSKEIIALQNRHSKWWIISESDEESDFGKAIDQCLDICRDIEKIGAKVSAPNVRKLIDQLDEAITRSDDLIRYYEKGGTKVDIKNASEFRLSITETFDQLRAIINGMEFDQSPKQSTALKVGSTESAVTEIQTALTSLGYLAARIDGVFGPLTHNAVIAFQKANKLEPTGEVDESLMALIRTKARENQPPTSEPQPADSISSKKTGYWLIKINGNRWPVEDFVAGRGVYFNSDPARDDYPLFQMLASGDSVLAFAYNRYFSIVCVFEVIHSLHEDDSLGEIVQLRIKLIVDPISFDSFQYKISFADKLLGKNPTKLFPLSEEIYRSILSSSTDGQAVVDAPELVSRLHSDEFSLDQEDILGYDLHASNLFNIMADAQTNPPLNIGILAPWGRGKTNLMRKVQRLFTKESIKIQALQNKGKKEADPFKLDDLRNWLKKKELFTPDKIPYATVWFNPWNYQSSEMIWAGMANAIVEQVVDQMPSQSAKEGFWFQLALDRIDKDELRRDLQFRVVFYAAQFFAWSIAVLAIAGWLICKEAIWSVPLGIGAIAGTFSSIYNAVKPNKKSIKDTFEKYVKAPQYLSKLGTFHEVHEDLKKVFNLLIDEKLPLVVFVDDLDRCSPAKVVEVVEAINVFISGDYRTKCYFVLGMDAEIVAASLDVAYEKMKGKVVNRETEQGSLGWYFLDKFIQLPFFIPIMSEEKKAEYLKSLLGHSDDKELRDERELAEDEIIQIARKVMATQSIDEAQKMFEKQGRSQRKEIEKAILKQQVEENKDRKEISSQVDRHSKYLNSDPRSLKRFANLLRFYNSYQVLRKKKGEDHVPINYLGKFLVLMLKFPQLIRWIQWDTESRNGTSTSANLKVQWMDEAIKAILKHKKTDHVKLWTGEIPFPEGEGAEAVKTIQEVQKEMTWMKSRSLFEILASDSVSAAELKNTLKCNVW